jgi:hypothetical protein
MRQRLLRLYELECVRLQFAPHTRGRAAHPLIAELDAFGPSLDRLRVCHLAEENEPHPIGCAMRKLLEVIQEELNGNR